nr:reverse transcriptase domain-containing protein [Tanacetum cinerariifolium]
MHTHASSSELIEPLEETERTLNRRLHRRNTRVPFEGSDERPENPREVYPPILDITHFYHFLNLFKIHDPTDNLDDESMYAADHVLAPTPGSAITIPKTANEISIKGNHLTLLKGNQFDDRIKTNPHKHQKPKAPVHKTVAFVDEGISNSDTDKIMSKMDAMTMKIDARYKEMRSHTNCNHYGDNHSTADCNDDDTPMSQEEEAKFLQTF